MTQFEIECLDSKVYNARDHWSRFVIDPLKPGQGTTLGNAIRRTLLSELEGLAITAVRIAGVSHEFSTINGIREDVLEILLNLKEIVFSGQLQQSTIGRLTVQGPAIVTAKSFELPPEIKLIDSEQYIATICGNNTLEMEFKIEAGSGYKIVDKDSSTEHFEFLQVDSVFMPVKKVNFRIEETRGENNSLNEQLILDIWTNGSISAKEAISNAADNLINLFSPLKTIDGELETDYETNETSHINQILIEELQLSVRAYNCLKRAHIHSVADLLDYSQEDLIEIKNFGQKSAEEVIDALQKRLGINLPKEKTTKIYNK